MAWGDLAVIHCRRKPAHGSKRVRRIDVFVKRQLNLSVPDGVIAGPLLKAKVLRLSFDAAQLKENAREEAAAMIEQAHAQAEKYRSKPDSRLKILLCWQERIQSSRYGRQQMNCWRLCGLNRKECGKISDKVLRWLYAIQPAHYWTHMMKMNASEW